jgi:hypothetical protein
VAAIRRRMDDAREAAEVHARRQRLAAAY